MQLSARVKSSPHYHEATVQTGDVAKSVSIPPKAEGSGSAVNGGELLLLALATCFCNDLYREATRRRLAVAGVEVTGSGEFGAEGEPGRNFTYSATVQADAAAEEIAELIRYVDGVAEIHNTLRQGVAVTLVS